MAVGILDQTVSKSYDGKHELVYEADARTYQLNGNCVFGVSSATNKGFPEAEYLTKWKMNEGIKAALAHLSQAECVTEEYYTAVLQDAEWAWKRKSSISTSIGTTLHEYAYAVEGGKLFDERKLLEHLNSRELLHCVAQFKEYKEGLKEEIVHLETPVASPKYLFAGTFDKMSIREGKLGITDYKTSTSISITHWLQLAKYAVAAQEWFGVEVGWLEVARFDKEKKKEIAVVDSPGMLKELRKQAIRDVATAQFRDAYDGFWRNK